MLVYATLFVCGGKYTQETLFKWQEPFRGHSTVILVVGECRISAGESAVHRIPYPKPVLRMNQWTKYTRAKFELWTLPYDRVVYYDIDIYVKAPVNRCARLCTASFCAVRDPIATWPVKSQRYFNSGFMVLTPSKRMYNALLEGKSLNNDAYVDQDVLNRAFPGWQKLPARCNWLLYKQNRPTALTDEDVFAVHKP